MSPSVVVQQGLPSSVGSARNASFILAGCPNHLNWLLLMWRRSCSSRRAVLCSLFLRKLISAACVCDLNRSFTNPQLSGVFLLSSLFTTVDHWKLPTIRDALIHPLLVNITFILQFLHLESGSFLTWRGMPSKRRTMTLNVEVLNLAPSH